MIKMLCERLLERGNGDLLDGCEDKTSRGMLDLAAAYEIKRLRSILKAIADATDKGARYESLAVWNTAEGALRGIVDPVLPAEPGAAAQRCDYVGMYDAQCGLDLGHAGEHRLFGPHRGALKSLAPLTPYGEELLERAKLCQCGICEACEFSQRMKKAGLHP